MSITAKNKKTQCQRLLAYLRKNRKGITTMEAFEHLRITCVHKRIAELEAKLAEAIDLAGEAIPYVSDYFRTKYEMDASFAKLLPSQNANHNTGDTEQNVG